MGFRTPLTSAVDLVARQAAADALTAATTSIIPGTRLAADAIDGRTIRGATLVSAPLTAGVDKGASVRVTQKTTAPPGTPNAYESFGVVELRGGNYPATPAAELGVWSDDEPGKQLLTLHSGQQPTAPGSTRPTLYHYVEDKLDGTGKTQGVIDQYADRHYLSALNVHGPGQLTFADGATLPRVQSYAGAPLTGVRSGMHLYNEGPGGSATSVMDLYAKRFWLGGGGVLDGDTEIRTSAGMRSAWHAWNGVDDFGLQFVAPDAGWSAGLNHYMIRGGWFWWTCRLARTSWAANQRICALPKGFPPADLDVPAVNDNGASAGAVRIRASDGAVFCLNAGGPGIHFTAIWPHKL